MNTSTGFLFSCANMVDQWTGKKARKKPAKMPDVFLSQCCFQCFSPRPSTPAIRRIISQTKLITYVIQCNWSQKLIFLKSSGIKGKKNIDIMEQCNGLCRWLWSSLRCSLYSYNFDKHSSLSYPYWKLPLILISFNIFRSSLLAKLHLFPIAIKCSVSLKWLVFPYS